MSTIPRLAEDIAVHHHGRVSSEHRPAEVMTPLGGLGFYNGGAEAGASQRHKHLQWIPDTAGGARLSPFTAQLPDNTPDGHAIASPALRWRHAFVRLPTHDEQAPIAFGAQLRAAFRCACAALGIDATHDPMPPYNLLVDGRWMVVIPRKRENCDHISVNALGFGTSLFVRHPEQIELIRRIGPLNLLATVGEPV
jgi:ATP adenylyltransferase